MAAKPEKAQPSTTEELVELQAEITEPEVVEPAFFPCACPCACGRDSMVPNIGGTALAKHARCVECGDESHLVSHPIHALPGEFKKNINEIYEFSDYEKELAKKVAKEVKTEIWQQQWEAWQRSLPEKFRNAETEHAQVKERLKRIAAKQNGVAGLVVLGAPGFGKTFLSIAYANAAIKAGYFKPTEVLFGSESELLAGAANSSFGEVEKAIQRVVSPKIKMIIIDDVGRGTWLNEAMRPKVFSLVLDKFWSENRVVVLTSNLNPAALGEYIGDGAMDRLRSLAGGASVVLDTESKRKKITEEMLKQAQITNEEIPPVPNLD
jgi:DNA replication protein DnaC